MASYTVIGVAIMALVCLLIGYEYVTFEPALERQQQVHYSTGNDEQVLNGITHVEEELKLLMERMQRQEDMFRRNRDGQIFHFDKNHNF